MTIYEAINGLLQYGDNKKIYNIEDKEYILNSLLSVFNLDDYKDNDYRYSDDSGLGYILNEMINYAIKEGLIDDTQTERDLLDAKIMGCLTPMPSSVNRTFECLKKEDAKKATDYLYELSKNVNYIRVDRIAKNIQYPHFCKYGKIDITINLSKPEKDPNEIKKLLSLKNVDYPKCMLCKENVNYRGRINFPARQNLRFVPVMLQNKKFYIQYSPYSYYDEHIICFKEEHSNMKVDIEAIKELVDFVSQFPHYFMGSNAGLPIVGGSILNHHHFQGGKENFPMTSAKEEFIKNEAGVDYNILKWPLNVIRLRCEDREKLIQAADKVLNTWKTYDNKQLMIIAKDADGEHNAVTPICRYRDGKYELDVVLRNNLVTVERPMGLYHPREKYWNIKKENIGLIEVMGLGILPARLKKEIELMKKYLLNKSMSSEEMEIFKIHLSFVENIKSNNVVNEENVDNLLRSAIGDVFIGVLEDCAVFKKESIEEFKNLVKIM